MRRAAVVGWVALALLFSLSFAFGRLWPEVTARACPFGADALRPDHTVCELAFGGLWVSLAMGVAAAALATALGLAVAVAARWTGGALDRAAMRFAEAFFSLPDVLVLMVLQFAAQTAGDLNPALKVSPPLLMVLSLAAVGWAAPARMVRSRLTTLEAPDYVAAARALGAGRAQVLRAHVWPFLRSYLLALFLARVPAAILAESTVSFLGIGRLEPMSLGRYLGVSSSALLYEGGGRIVLPAWGLLVAVVLAANLAGRSLGGAAPGRSPSS
ncbi:MAG TPA: ABC transporter permease subunit [Myxococcaceae bacterium]|nr:ABC transporter permease subunit [Myxococcaceae bacterium]